jgi:uncharacterized membrane protein
MAIYLLALGIGMIAGLRALAAPAVVSWAVYLGWLNVGHTWASFLGYWVVPYLLGLMAIGELITDQLPRTPARTVPVQFSARVINGAFCGAVLGAAGAAGMSLTCAGFGALGAVIGTRLGYTFRVRLAQQNDGRDRPGALLEDAIAILGAFLIVRAAS